MLTSKDIKRSKEGKTGTTGMASCAGRNFTFPCVLLGKSSWQQRFGIVAQLSQAWLLLGPEVSVAQVHGIWNPVTSQSLSSKVVLLLHTPSTRQVKERFCAMEKLVHFK